VQTRWSAIWCFCLLFFVEVLRGPTVHAILSPEAGQRGPMDRGSSYRLLELASVRHTLFTPPLPPSTTTPLMAKVEEEKENTIPWETTRGPTRAEWDKMRWMGAVLMEMFIIFAERFLVEPGTQATCDY